jgi:glycosyltransferase involved in cell wall biosynthesis
MRVGRRVLHVLSQRPSLTGSGITLDALVRHAAAAGWDQHVVAGIPAGEAAPRVGGLPADSIHPLCFGSASLPYPVPGMSDVMPYPSTRFAAMTADQLAAYRGSWRAHLTRVLHAARPHVIHAHHVWLLGAMLKDIAADTPVVTHCHATGLRQLRLCPHLADEVRTGCARNDAFVVLHRGHATDLVAALGTDEDHVHVVGAGFRDDLFHCRERDPGAGGRLVYVGKLSAAKGLPQLLDAFAALADRRPGLELHVAGAGSGPEAETLTRRMRSMAPAVVLHGQLDQPALAALLRRSAVCVLPSYYEGLPLVLVEALACGCRLVATRLPGVELELEPHLGTALCLVDPPPMASVDVPQGEALPAFVTRLESALDAALDLGPVGTPDPETLDPFTWAAVYRRVERVWLEVLASASASP